MNLYPPHSASTAVVCARSATRARRGSLAPSSCASRAATRPACLSHPHPPQCSPHGPFPAREGGRGLGLPSALLPLPSLPHPCRDLAVFAIHRHRQPRQTPLNSRLTRETHPIQCEKRQKRQCSPIQSTLPPATAARRLASRHGSHLVLACLSATGRNVTERGGEYVRIHPYDLPMSPDAAVGATLPAAKSHGAWVTRTSLRRGTRGSCAAPPAAASVRCSPNGYDSGYSFLISPAGYHLACAARLACAISNVLMRLFVPLQILALVLFPSRLRISSRLIWLSIGVPSG